MSNPTLPAIARVMAAATSAAYDDYAHKSVQVPSGWRQVAQVRGWSTVALKEGHPEKFALVLQSTGDPTSGLVAFRGTASVSDAIDDLAITTSRFTTVAGAKAPRPAVADGFLGIYTKTGGSLQRSMQDTLFDLLETCHFRHLAITGHSLGGALAKLFAFDVAVSRPAIGLQVITFAAPKVGGEAWSTEYGKQAALAGTIRVVNSHDVVPTCPQLDAYHHVGSRFGMQFQSSGLVNPLDLVTIRHSLDNYSAVLDRTGLPGTTAWTGSFHDSSHDAKVVSEANDESLVETSRKAVESAWKSLKRKL